ncbi:MAG TPA: membrane protein insertase YidC, partial [Vampirovibrionales bacterium]
MDFSLITYHLILPMLEYFRHMLGSYGWSIIVVTLVIKAILLPLSVKQILSSKDMQAKMAKLKPEMERVQDRFKQKKARHESNPEKLQEIQQEFQTELAALYKKNGGINPLGGCLPTLLQFPILIALYWAFSGPPFQPSVVSIGLDPTTKFPTKEISSIKKLHSKTVNYVDADGRLGRIKLETDIPKKPVVGQEYNLEVKEVSGKAKFNLDKVNWRLLPKGTNHQKAAENEEISDWSKDLVELNIKEDNPLQATFKALKQTDKFHLQFFVDEKRAHQSFFFIKDLGAIGLWDGEKKKLHWDVVILVALMGLSFWGSSKLMMSNGPQTPSLDPNQEKMQKQMQTLMPVMFLGMMAFLPIPA